MKYFLSFFNTLPKMASTTERKTLFLAEKTAQMHTKHIFKKLKNIFSIFNKEKRQHVWNKPWYIVFGNKDTGKHALIQSSGLKFTSVSWVQPEPFFSVDQDYCYQFYIAKDAIVLSITQTLSTIESEIKTTEGISNDPTWLGIIRFIKRYRRFRPLQGFILTLNLPELMLSSEMTIHKQKNSISILLNNLSSHFHIRIPFYIMLTKLDMIAGFRDFFSQLYKDEQEQMCGFSFPPPERNRDKNGVLSTEKFFDSAYDRWTSSLNQRLLTRLDMEKIDKNSQVRARISYFPQQMQLFKNKILAFIQTSTTTHMRGVYFTSTEQGNSIYDFVMLAASTRFQTPNPSLLTHTSPEKKIFFAQTFFSNLILPETKWLRDTTTVQEYPRRLRKKIYKISLALLILSTFGLIISYNSNHSQLVALQHHIDAYPRSVKKPSSQEILITDTLPQLDRLKKIHETYTSSQPWFIDFEFFAPRTIRKTIENTWQKGFHELFTLRVVTLLEKRLRQYLDNKPELLYEALKGYVALGNLPHTQISWIKPPLLSEMNLHLINQPEAKIRLLPYIDILSQTLMTPVSLNSALLDDVRSRLKQIPTIELAYYELKLAIEHKLPKFNFSDNLGARFLTIFRYENHSGSLPSPYTSAGFKHLSTYSSSELQQKNHDIFKVLGINETKDNPITLTKQITPQIWTRYAKEYTEQWKNLLAQIHIVPFRDLPHAISVLTEMTGSPNPLTQLLETVKNNTAQIQNAHVNIASSFQNLHVALNNKSLIPHLIKLRDYLISLENSPNRTQAQYDAVKAYMQGHDSPIKQLKLLAQTFPSPLSQWLHHIAEESAGVMLQAAHRAANEQWQFAVLPLYESDIQGRFPFSKQTESMVSLENFGNFFGANGALAQFITQSIQPFVDTSKTPWKVIPIGRHTIGIPANILSTLERAHQFRLMYFSDGTNLPSASFSIQPRKLDAKASGVHLQLASTELHYRHGPLEPISLRWPLQGDHQQVVITISGFEAKPKSLSFSGSWAWFQLLKATQLTATKNPGHYIWSITQEGLTASFEITTANNMPLFNLDLFENLTLPKEL